MEAKQTPVIKVLAKQPPSEPPPSLQSSRYQINSLQTQWIEDVTHQANIMIEDDNTRNAAYLCGHEYTPRIKKLSINNEINKYHLQHIRLEHKTRQKKRPSP